MNDKLINQIIKENIEIFKEKELISKGLYDNQLNEKYFVLYKNYKILLEKYLLMKLPLKEYDDKMSISEFNYIPVKNEDMDYYQYTSSMGLKYIYLRNNIYVEKLSLNDINILVNLSFEELNNPNNIFLEIIDRTYIDIIDRNDNQDTKLLVNYSETGRYYLFKSNELVFGIRHDNFADNGLDGDDWTKNADNQTAYLNKLISEISNISSEKLGNKVNFTIYNEFTANKKIR